MGPDSYKVNFIYRRFCLLPYNQKIGKYMALPISLIISGQPVRSHVFGDTRIPTFDKYVDGFEDGLSFFRLLEVFFYILSEPA